jgi:two-component system phosphate regulon sensor histidine kinase PhoR
MTIRVPAANLLATTALAAVPTALAFALLAALGLLTPGQALLATLGAAAGLALLVRIHLRNLLSSLAYVERLARTGQATPPAPREAGGRAATASGLGPAVARVRRAWNQRSEELGQLLEHSELVLDSLPNPLLLLGADLAIVDSNRKARDLFGPDLTGRSVESVLRDPDFLAAVQAAIETGTSREAEFVLTGRVERNLLGRCEPLAGQAAGEGGAARLIVSIIDLTVHRKTEEMRADFVANASHELRTPLATLIGFIDTLRTSGEDAETRNRFLGIMHEQAQRMAALVNDLLSLSQIELHEHSAPTGQVDLANLLGELADILTIRAVEKDMRITLDTGAAGPGAALVAGDEEELTQVFQNLIDNAIKYGRAGTDVEIAIRRRDQGPAGLGKTPAGVLCVAVRDHGEGIERRHLPRLTERFYRVDTARSRKLGGTGLGLAIVKHIVNRHRGVMTVDSEIGEGSTFSVCLPAAALYPAGR